MICRYYVEKSEFLGGTFACLDIGGTIYKWKISPLVKSFIDIKHDKDYDYIVTMEYENGMKDKEWLELKYDFNRVGLPSKLLQSIRKVVV